VKPLHRALTVALATALLCVLAAPATVLAATATTPASTATTATTAKDPYGESTPLNLPADTGSARAEIGGGSGNSLARTFIGLGIVVAIIYGLTWVLRQSKANSSKDLRATGFGLSTEATVPLGPGRSVHLIRAGRELVLVGSAEQGVVPIRTYSEAEALELGLLSPDGDDGPGAGSGGAMKTTIGQALERLRQRTAR
jgi:flagellar protein FliO/FliZ